MTFHQWATNIDIGFAMKEVGKIIVAALAVGSMLALGAMGGSIFQWRYDWGVYSARIDDIHAHLGDCRKSVEANKQALRDLVNPDKKE